MRGEQKQAPCHKQNADNLCGAALTMTFALSSCSDPCKMFIAAISVGLDFRASCVTVHRVCRLGPQQWPLIFKNLRGEFYEMGVEAGSKRTVLIIDGSFGEGGGLIIELNLAD